MIVQGVRKSLGYFGDEEAAARAYDHASIECGRLDQLNFDDYIELHETAEASNTEYSQPWPPDVAVEAPPELASIAATTHLTPTPPAVAAAAIAAAVAAAAATTTDTSGRKKSSRFRGVSWTKKDKKWKAQMRVQGVRKYLGNFDDEEAAARAYDHASIECGRLDQLNFDYGPRVEALAECAQSLESGEPVERSKYMTKGKCKDN
jgi:hypothetical protein